MGVSTKKQVLLLSEIRFPRPAEASVLFERMVTRMIELKKINKTFKIARRNAGLGEAVKALFRKEYTYVHALADVSFTINEGEMVGYIGPNGAGKSSTIKIMSGILTPDSGECLINGRTPWKDRIAHVKEIGVVFGQRSQLWWDVPVADSFELIRDIYKVDEPRFHRNLNELTELLDIGEIIRTPARQLSLGQRMRCEIAASLLHDPKTLFLDEPTIGLDAVSKIAVRSFIKTVNRERRTTIILTTHDMQDIEALTERILLIGKGKILLDGALSELKKRNSTHKTLTVDFIGAISELECGMNFSKYLDGHAEIVVDTEIISVSDALSVITKQAEISDLSIAGATAEEMVVSLYREFQI
jgi:ABC-2 type transport system ATP-binding protein